MGKYLWLLGALAFVGTLALVLWEPTHAPAPEAPPAEVGAREQARTPSPSATPTTSTPPSTPRAADPLIPAEPLTDPDLLQWEAATRLPRSVMERLRDSHSPLEQEMLRRNSELVKPRAPEPWGTDTQQRINEFLESLPQSAGLVITLACRDTQCQLQVTGPPPKPGEEPMSQVLIDELRRQWWYRGQLVLRVGQVGEVDGRLYHLQYFDRQPAAGP